MSRPYRGRKYFMFVFRWDSDRYGRDVIHHVLPKFGNKPLHTNKY